MILGIEKIINNIKQYEPVFPNTKSKNAFYWNITSSVCVISLASSFLIPENKEILEQGTAITEYLRYISAGSFLLLTYKMFGKGGKNFDSNDAKIPKFKKNYLIDTTTKYGKRGW